VNPARVLIVDDHRVVAEGLVRLLSGHFEVVETINDSRDIVNAVLERQPDVILLDASMPNVTGLEAMRRLKERGIAFKAIVLTMHADPSLAVEALKTGASGFVLKEASGEELLTAIEAVLSGNTYLASALTKEIVTLMVGATEPNRVELTTQQREVLRLIVRGLRTKEIAAALAASTRTIDATKHKIMQLLNVRSTAELVRYAVEHRLVNL
jgi:DNA-binding NarL/FixJ family response regulator